MFGLGQMQLSLVMLWLVEEVVSPLELLLTRVFHRFLWLLEIRHLLPNRVFAKMYLTKHRFNRQFFRLLKIQPIYFTNCYVLL